MRDTEIKRRYTYLQFLATQIFDSINLHITIETLPRILCLYFWIGTYGGFLILFHSRYLHSLSIIPFIILLILFSFLAIRRLKIACSWGLCVKFFHNFGIFPLKPCLNQSTCQISSRYTGSALYFWWVNLFRNLLLIAR